MADDKNPNLRKNGGKGTLVGNLLRGLVGIGKTVSPQFRSLLDAFTGEGSIGGIVEQLAKEGFDDNELKYLLGELDKDKIELEEITRRWVADAKSESWMAKNVRPLTLFMYNIALLSFIALDSLALDFNVKDMWITILLSNTGIINTAYFGSRYLQKRDDKKYK